MDEYKRKKVRKSSAKKHKKEKIKDTDIYFEDTLPEDKEKLKKNRVKNNKPLNDIDNTEDIEEASRKNFKVINNPKKGNFKKFLNSLFVVGVLTAVILILSFSLPGGILESVSGFFSSLGRGKYPIEYNGSLIADSQTIDSCNFLLNDTTLTAYNNNGKELFKYQHALSKPVLVVSQSRALLFNEGGTDALIFNKSGLQKSIKADSEIISGTIGRNGYFALSCYGKEYTSSVYVYSKKAKKIYTWNSAKDIVNSLCISPNGKKIAVSCLNVSNATAKDKLYVLEYTSADPVFSKDYDSDIILSMFSNQSGFATLSEKGYNYYSWNKYKSQNINVKDKNLSMFRTNKNNSLLVFNRNSNKTDNKIIFISSSGKKYSEIDFNETVTDIQFKNGRIFIVSDTKIYIYSKKGKLISSADCDYGIKRFYIISNNSIAAIMDDRIEKITI